MKQTALVWTTILCLLLSNLIIATTIIAEDDNNWYLYQSGYTWNIYRHGAVTYRLESHTGFINYYDNGWYPIDCNISVLPDGHLARQYDYIAGNEHGIFNVYFKRNSTDNYPVCFAYSKSDNPVIHTLRSKLIGVGYLDPSQDWRYEILQSVQYSVGYIDGADGIYPDVFTGTDAIWGYRSGMLKEELICSEQTKTLLQNNPPSDFGLSNQHSYLVFATRLDYTGLIPEIDGEGMTGNFTTDGSIEFRDVLGAVKFAFPVGYVYEQDDFLNQLSLTYRLIQYQDEYYLLAGIKAMDLNAMDFPVVFDPSMTIYGDTDDGGFAESDADYPTVHDKLVGIPRDTTVLYVGQYGYGTGYSIYRSSLVFNTSIISDQATVLSANLSFKGFFDFSDDDFYIVVQKDDTNVSPHAPLIDEDYYYDNYSGDCGSMNTSDFVTGVVYNDIVLNNSGIIHVNITGFTKFFLKSDQDIISDAPVEREFVYMYSADRGGTGDDPKLTVTYQVDVSTSVDSIHPYIQCYSPFNTSATGNEELDNVTLWYRYSTDNSSWNWSYENYSYDTGDKDVDIVSGSKTLHFQTFTIGNTSGSLNNTFLLKNAWFKLKRTGVVTGIYCTLYDVNATNVPTTKLVDSVLLSGAGISDSSFDWYKFIFDGYELERGTMYAFSWRLSGIGFRVKIEVQYNSSHSFDYESGSRWTKTTAVPPVVTEYPMEDFPFNVSGDWILWNGTDDSPNPDTTNASWSWDFNCPGNGSDVHVRGYYEFFSIGTSEGDVEGYCTSGDTMCYFVRCPAFMRDRNPLPIGLSLGCMFSICFGLLFVLMCRKKKKKSTGVINEFLDKS